MVKFTMNVLFAAILAFSGSFGSSLSVVENFLTPEEINHYYYNVGAQKLFHGQRRLESNTMIGSDLIRRLEQVGAILPIEHDRELEITKSIITETTERHVDFIVNKRERRMDPLSHDTIFVFLNTNPEAEFVYGDDERVPVIAGDMVIFSGGEVEHNTEIKSGNVHLLGPFESRKLDLVGQQCGTQWTLQIINSIGAQANEVPNQTNVIGQQVIGNNFSFQPGVGNNSANNFSFQPGVGNISACQTKRTSTDNCVLNLINIGQTLTGTTITGGNL
jgi:hypothetical protein